MWVIFSWLQCVNLFRLSDAYMHHQMMVYWQLDCWEQISKKHYDDVIMTLLTSQITSLTVVYSIVYSGVNQRKHQSSTSLAFVREIHRGPVNFPHKWPVTRKMFPFDDVIMIWIILSWPQCVNSLRSSDACIHWRSMPSSVQIMACHLFDIQTNII